MSSPKGDPQKNVLKSNEQLRILVRIFVEDFGEDFVKLPY